MAKSETLWKKTLVVPVLGLFSLVLTIFLSFSSPMQRLKLNVVDELFQIRGPIPIQDTTVVIVPISQQADQSIPYKYPWPMDLHAKLVEHLNEAGAAAIGFDVIFDKYDKYDPQNDTTFANTLTKYGNVVLGASVENNQQNRGQGTSSLASTMVAPNSLLRESNPNPVGIVRAWKDADASIRKYILDMNYNDHRYLSMGLELLKLRDKISSDEIYDGSDTFNLGPFNIPKYNSHLMAINYFGGPGTFPTYDFDTVIDDSTVILASEDSTFQMNAFSDPNFGLKYSNAFKNKIVLVGATMPELHDLHSTPFADQGNMSGVEMHANAIQTILSGKYIHYISPTLNLLILLLLILVTVWLTRKLTGFWGFGIYLALAMVLTGATLFGFLHFRFVMDLVAMLMSITVGYITTQSYEYVVEQREKRRIRSLFSSYVSPAVVEEMVESGKDPKLGGDDIYMTAFFSDIQSFSTFSEKLPAQTLVKLLNDYLSAMTKILTDHGGTLDKYIGDAIVAFFGAPVPKEDHAYKACIVSQLMQMKLGELREKWKAEGEEWPEIVHHMRNRIGINTGRMVTGNMGSENRFNYTMMGDNVNIAARCESGAKQYGVYTMVTGATKEEAEQYGDRCVFRYLDRIVVKGRTKPVDVYEIMGLRDHISDELLECKQKYESAMEAYQNQEWNQAISLFKESLELEAFTPDEEAFISTNPSLVFLDRCLEMKEDPPPEDWNGVYVMKSK